MNYFLFQWGEQAVYLHIPTKSIDEEDVLYMWLLGLSPRKKRTLIRHDGCWICKKDLFMSESARDLGYRQVGRISLENATTVVC